VRSERSALRASDADRERLAAVLGQQYAAGRIDLAELDRRLDAVLRADTLEQAAAQLHDLPASVAPAAAQRVSRRRRRGRHGEADAPQPGWAPTLERFRDPSTGVVMRVWLDPADASRHYIADSASG
jgi:hypothetical protein